MNDNGTGCLTTAGVAAVVILFAALAFGAPILSSAGLSWDNSAAIAREEQRTERTRINAQRDVRVAEEQGETARQVAIAVAVVGAFGAAAWATTRSVEAWAARPHRPQAQAYPQLQPPQHIIVMARPHLAAMRDARLVFDDQAGAWVVVSDVTETAHYLTDGRQP